jgi:hypothetical protein
MKRTQAWRLSPCCRAESRITYTSLAESVQKLACTACGAAWSVDLSPLKRGIPPRPTYLRLVRSNPEPEVSP